MTGAASVLLVFALITLCGGGVVALLGLAATAGQVVRSAALAPLAGAAALGVAGATLGTLGARLGIGGAIALTLATCAAGAARLARARPQGTPPPVAAAPDSERLLALMAILPIAGLSVLAIVESHQKPLAEYDGWAMWGMKARALATLASADPAVFASDAYARLHLEYPLLLPSLDSLPLQIASAYSSHTVVLSSLALGIAGLLGIAGVWRNRVRAAVLLPCLAVLAAIPAFFLQLQTGYADVPLAVFVAGGLAASARWLADDQPGWLPLATLFLAAAALTKNEGLLFALAGLVPLFALAHGRRARVAISGAVVLLAYAPWRTYTSIHDLSSPDYDLSASFDLRFVGERLERGPAAARTLFETTLDPDRFALALPFALAVTVVAVAAGRRRLGAFALGFTAIALAGLSWIYVLTPHDLTFFLSTNAERVVVAPLLGLVALTPLLVEDTARSLAARRPPSPVGRPR